MYTIPVIPICHRYVSRRDDMELIAGILSAIVVLRGG